MALIGGGVLGVLGAVITEAQGGGLFLPWVGAPIIEELAKPLGIYYIWARWPATFRKQVYVAALCALAGVAFGLVESTVYVKLYVSDPSSSYIAFRYTIPVMLHALASFVFGLGLNRPLIQSLQKKGPVPRTMWFLPAAMAIHSIYNTVVTFV